MIDSTRPRLRVATTTRDPNISDVEETTKGGQNDKACDVMIDEPNAKYKPKRGVKLNILITLLPFGSISYCWPNPLYTAKSIFTYKVGRW
jgi:hypothetical protein